MATAMFSLSSQAVVSASFRLSASSSPTRNAATQPNKAVGQVPGLSSFLASSSSSVFAQVPVSQIIRPVASKSASRKNNPAVSPRASLSKSVLIVNTNGGGHAVIGFWLARLLQNLGHSVTILTVGDEISEKMFKPPFSRFSELREVGVKTVWGNPSDLSSAVKSQSFDVVLDNNGKDLASVKPVVDWAKSSGASQFLFISSAGMYKTSDETPYVEGDPVKPDAGHALVEEYIAQQFGSAWASFRPQYITGSGNNKDCEEWFFDRIVRNRPVPIPSPGIQLTVVAHAADIASMIALAIEKPHAAAGGIFNAVGGRTVTFDGMVRLCAQAAGREAKIVHYDPKAAGVDVKKAFPFRNQHFYSEPRAAVEKLGWRSITDLGEALKERYNDYVASGRASKTIKFDLDDKILASQ